MPSQENKIKFSVTRNDLLFDFDQKFDNIFRFRYSSLDDFSSSQGNLIEEDIGFDFQNQCDPAIEINPIRKVIEETTGQSGDDFSVYITLEDIALSIRKVVYEQSVSDILDKIVFNLNLENNLELAFHRGFIVNCLITRNSDQYNSSNTIWSKSQVVYQANFIARSIEGEALFEITWKTFPDSSDKKGVLFYVDWLSSSVSSLPHTDCFEVIANIDLKTQFKRLENNTSFGELCIRFIAERIISELTKVTLKFADIKSKPDDGSLHQKLQGLFEEMSMDFDQLAKVYQNGDEIDKLQIFSRISKGLQGYTKIGQTLNKIKFGGFR